MIGNTTSATSVLDSPSTTKGANANDAMSAQDRFLKLLVAQMNNQDPMNPLDNAQMTSQIAQINTVTGIEKLNETVKGLVGQFSAQQLMQGSAMVGRNVLIADNTLAYDATNKKGGGAFDLSGSASATQIQIFDASNKQVGTVDLGPLQPGRYNFEWDAANYTGSAPLRFKVLAANGDSAVESVALAVDQVTAVSMDNGALALQLSRGGTANYGAIKAIL